MERAMIATSLAESWLRRAVVIAGATAAVILALVVAKPFYSATTHPKPADISERVADQKPAIELAAIVASPTIETDAQLFYGCGDGSNGYYAERAEPALTLLRYQRMP
jgi:hypothetical protein